MRTFIVTAGLAALAAVANAGPMSREEAMVEASRLAEYQQGFATVVPLYLELAVPGRDADCKKVSRMFHETCSAYDCSNLNHRVPDQGSDHLAHQTAMLCCHHSCGPAAAFDAEATAAEMTAHTDHFCRWTAVESCEVASWDLKKELAKTESGDCCDTCAFPSRDPNTGELSDAYKASCTADDYQGHSVCGAPANSGHDGMSPNSDVYFRGECSAGPEITLTGVHEECHWDDAKQAEVCDGRRRCEAKYSDYEMDSFLKAMAADAAPTANDGSVVASIEDLSDADRGIMEGLFGLATRAYVVNNPAEQAAHPADYIPAKITVSTAEKDDGGNQCFQSMIESYTESEIYITSGHTWMYNTTATKDATTTVTGSASIDIVGGNNAGSVRVHGSNGRIRLAGIANSGPVTVDGARSVFISGGVNNGQLTISKATATVYGTTNHADIVVDRSSFDAYQVDNTGSVTIKASAFDHLEFCSNTGSVVIEQCRSGVCTVSAPEGSNLSYPPSVTYIAYTGPPCGEITLPIAPPLPRPPPAAFQCIEEKCDDEHAICMFASECGQLYELLKREDRPPTDEEVAALEGDDLAAFHGVSMCYKGKCEEPEVTECLCSNANNMPVCGSNGVTYSNECEARCAHQHDFVGGACSHDDKNAFDCIEEKCDDEHAICMFASECDQLYELLKREDRPPTDEEVAALEGDDLAAFHGVSICYKGKCEEKPPIHQCPVGHVHAPWACIEGGRLDEDCISRPERRSCAAGHTLVPLTTVNGGECGDCPDPLALDYLCCAIEPGEECMCSTDYRPVCGSNGVTYSNECEARCAHQHDFVGGTCSHDDKNAFDCIEEKCDDEHAICMFASECGQLYELLKREDRPPTDEEVAALEGDDLAAFHGVSMCYKGKCEENPEKQPSATSKCVDPAHNCQCTDTKVAQGHCGGAPGCYTATTEEECRGHHDIWLGNNEVVIRGRIVGPDERDAVLESVSQSLSAAVEALQSLFSH